MDRNNRTNVKLHDKGVMTYTLKSTIFDELPLEVKERAPEIYRHGWGNGYVAIPYGHPFLRFVAYDTESYNYDQMPDIDGQEWTYSDIEEIDGKHYLTLGFDTGHYMQTAINWPEERVVSTIEAYVLIVNRTWLQHHYHTIKDKIRNKINIWRWRREVRKHKKKLDS